MTAHKALELAIQAEWECLTPAPRAIWLTPAPRAIWLTHTGRLVCAELARITSGRVEMVGRYTDSVTLRDFREDVFHTWEGMRR